jgi:hypothetical protein
VQAELDRRAAGPRGPGRSTAGQAEIDKKKAAQVAEAQARRRPRQASNGRLPINAQSQPAPAQPPQQK